MHALRDPTRGGLAVALNELAAAIARRHRDSTSAAVPVPAPRRGRVRAAGPRPAHVANEGCLVALVAPDAADVVLAAMRDGPEAPAARVIGKVHVDFRAG